MKTMETISDQETLFTSISISHVRRKRLLQAAEELEVSMTDLLSVLLYKSRTIVGDEAITRKKVQYQREGGYTIMPVYLYEIDHEYAGAMRYIFKKSVSLVLGKAIDLFLDEIVEKGIDRREITSAEARQKNNYAGYPIVIRDYTIEYSQNSKYEYWKLCWDKQKE